MRISELEKALKRVIITNPGHPILVFLSADGATIPSEFAVSARSIERRDSQHVPGRDILQAAAAKWA